MEKEQIQNKKLGISPKKNPGRVANIDVLGSFDSTSFKVS